MDRPQLRAPRRVRNSGTHSVGEEMTNDQELLAQVAAGTWHAPHDVLGLHTDGATRVVRALRPLAESVTAVLSSGERAPLSHLADGIWHGRVPDDTSSYELVTTYDNAPTWTTDDWYRHLP